jgi:hypothetical protein
MTILPQTEIKKKRAAWWEKHFKPGMTITEVFELNARIMSLFPKTDEERRQKAEDLENMPEFVL